MTKYKFSDGLVIVASTKEEAKEKHKAMIKADYNPYENAAENIHDAFYRVEDSVSTIKEAIDKGIKALDVVKQSSFSKETVKEYLLDISEQVKESEVDDNVKNLEGYITTLTSKPSSLKEWKNLCLSMLPSINVGKAEEIEEALEELCR